MTEQELIREGARLIALSEGVDPMTWNDKTLSRTKTIMRYRDKAYYLMDFIRMVVREGRDLE